MQARKDLGPPKLCPFKFTQPRICKKRQRLRRLLRCELSFRKLFCDGAPRGVAGALVEQHSQAHHRHFRYTLQQRLGCLRQRGGYVRARKWREHADETHEPYRSYPTHVSPSVARRYLPV